MPDHPDTLYTRTLRALQDTTACPACTATLRAGRCAACGLDVSGPDGALVWRDSQAVVRALTARQDRVAALRAVQTAGRGGRAWTPRVQPPTTHAPAALATAPAAAPRAHVPVVATPSAARRPSATARPGPPAAVPRTAPAGAAALVPIPVPAPTPAPAPAPAPAERRPWRVQTVLQVVGAALLVAASITFLVFAWDVMGLRGRAAVIGVGTLVVFALASWLRARRLPQGAEAVGALAVVLLLLDAWAVRATGVVSLGDGTGQAGVSALVCGALLTAWGVRSRLRAGAVAGAALVPLAPLAWLPAVPDAAAACALLLAGGVLTAARAVPPWCHGRAERTVMRIIAALLLPAAVVTATVGGVVHLTSGPWTYVALLAAAAVALAGQVAVEARTVALGSDAQPSWSTRGARVMRGVWAAAGAVTATAAAATALTAVVAPRTDGVTASQAAVVGACLVAAALVLVPRGRAWDTDVLAAERAALLGAAGAASWSVLVVVAWTGTRLAVGTPRAFVADAGTAAVGALVVAGALGLLTARRGERRTARAAAVAWRTVVVLVAVALPVLAATADVVLVAGQAVVLAGFLVADRRTGLGPVAARAGAVAAAVLAVLGAAPDAAWTAAALVLGAVLAVLARSWSHSPASGPASTVVAAGLLLAAGAVGGTATGLPPTTALALTVAPVAAALLARARVVGAAARGGAERDAALTAVVLALAVAWPSSAVVVGAPPRATGSDLSVLVTAAPLVTAAVALALVVVLLRWGRAWGAVPELPTGGYVVLGAAAAAPVAALTVATGHLALGLPGQASSLLVTTSGVVTAVCAPLLRPSGGDVARRAAEVSGTVVVAAGVAVATASGAGATAVTLLLAAVGAAACALARDRRWAWWVALGLATSAWWVLLGARDTTVVEPYTLPPALVVAAVGAWRVARRRDGGARLLAAGLALATLPTAVLPPVLEVGARWVDRGLLAAAAAVGVVGAALLLARRRPGAAEVLAGLGAVLLVVGPLARAATAAQIPTAAPTGPALPDGSILVEAWSWPAVLGLAACAAVVRSPRVRAVLDRTVPWALLAAATAPTLLAVLAAPSASAAVVRATVLAAAAATLTLVGGATGRRTSAPGAPAPASGTDGAPAGTGLTGLGLALTAAAVAGATSVLASHAPPVAVGTAQDLPLLVGGLVTLAAVALTARRGPVPLAWAAVGALALLPSALVRGADLRLLLWGATAAVLLALARIGRPPAPGTADPPAARRPGRLPAADVPWVLTGTALLVMVAGPWAAALGPGDTSHPASLLRVELVAALTWFVALHHARTWRSGPVGPALRATQVALLVLPCVLAVDVSALGTLRGVLVLAGGGALAWWARDQVGTWLGVGAASLATAALALRGGPEPADVPWTVLGLLVLALGVRQMHREPTSASWPTLGPPLGLALGAPLTGLVVAPVGWRVTALLVLGVVVVVAGAVRRWQAPLLLGAAAVLTTLVVVLSPLAAGALAAVDGWILLAVGGTLVLGLGVTYERRAQQAREAVRFVREMR
ncbi:SCO7613 C-terminal domain-containing membrane protein [Cellulomonas xiejunii]|uniref:SCO7613 C-terminal domain-containing membrane protein n=1 Tax=Cellulomonas xiejunii TaxID=2968083 RepID=UPI001D0EEB44|nr:hypothetical protein [Cellulomonas xiejunii]MCC2313164.1 hypothetical protein [Cellulomonas xiejunii]